jgi:ribosomal protein L11 methyltransferase
MPPAAVGSGSAANWKLMLVVPADAVELFSAALEPFVLSVASFAVTPAGPWTVEAYADAPPDRGAVEAAVMIAAAAVGIAAPPVQVEAMKVKDWLTANRQSFQPIRAGRFFVHPSHYRAAIPAGAVPVLIDAATAFGSGTHGSTFGCLIAIDRLLPCLRGGLLLDVGCGSGILSIAMAKAGGWPVLAADIDPESVRVCRVNVRANGVADRVQAVCSRGLCDRRIATSGPYPLIVANILARPLMMMAAGIAAAVAPGGHVVLSGLLIDQEVPVMGAYRRCGLVLGQRITVGGWRTLILRRP